MPSPSKDDLEADLRHDAMAQWTVKKVKGSPIAVGGGFLEERHIGEPFPL